MMPDVGRRTIANPAWWVALTYAALSVLAACGAGRDAAVDDVTSPIAPYVEQEKLDTISEEEAATALGAGELSHADGNRILGLQEVARRWAASSQPLWTSLLDPDAPYEDFVPLLDAARDDLVEIATHFDAGVESLDDPGIADSLRPFAQSIRDQLEAFENLAGAVASVDTTAVEVAAKQLNNVLTQGHEAQDAMLAGLRAYIDEDGYCASLPDDGAELPELCGTPVTTVG